MKKTLCILLALMTTVMIMSAVVFATEEAADNDTEVVAEETQSPEESTDAEPVEEEMVPIQVMEVTVNKDGSSSTALTMPVPKNYEDQIDGIIEQYSSMEGVTAEVIDDYNGVKAIKVTEQRDSAKPISVSTPGSSSSAFEAWNIKGLFKNITVMNASYDFSQGYYEEGEEIAQIKVNLPKKPKYTNAETVNGKTYEWILKGGQANSIRFVMEKCTIAGWIACAIIICLIILLILLVLSKKNKKDTDFIPETFENNIAEGLNDTVEGFEDADENEEDSFDDVEEEITEEVEDATEETDDEETPEQ